MSVSIDIENVVKRYGDKTIIDGLSLMVSPGEFFTLLGPSGCGKTTLLRMIIGFNTIEGGEIKINGNVINNIPVNKRNMGMVFQNYAIFPHMSVKENVAFGLKNRGLSKQEIEDKIKEILDIVKIDEYKDRMPDKLSGGQQQRVALARAIVIHPQVLMMDEPLSNLDAKLRVEMRNAIKNIQQQVGITTVYVTHDQEEALAVSDRIAVMHEGKIQQIGTPRQVFERPLNVFVSNFIGVSNILEANIETNGGERNINFDNNYIVKMDNLRDDIKDDLKVLVSVRPHEFIISKNEEGIKGIIKGSMFLGLNTHYFVALEDGKEIEVIQNSDLSDIIPNGTRINLEVKPNKINVFDCNSQKTLIQVGEKHEYAS